MSYFFFSRRVPGDNLFCMWKGRFKQETAESMLRLSESVSFDWRLYRQDIAGSIAHAAGLLAAGILDDDEFESIKQGLREIREEIESGEFEWDESLEDIHMNIEAALTKRLGQVGAKLHTARSRNDQVATATRLYVLESGQSLATRIVELQRQLVQWAKRSGQAYLPGYTHLQRAQPVYFAHHLLAYVEMFERDHERMQDCMKRTNVSPLGSGALAGSTLAIDREIAAGRLGFSGLTANSMDAVSDRDFVVEMLSVLALLGVHLSRLAEDIVLWASSEFNYVHLSDAYTTGSSLMPQKKNPDAAELARGKCGRLTGNLVTLLTVLKGLPMTYNRDLQEDKEPLFDSIDTAALVMDVMAEMISEADINQERMAETAADPMLLATDLADYLVSKGMPFRQAHETVGKLTAKALAEGCTLKELTLSDYRDASELFDDDVFGLLEVECSLAARKASGAPAFENVTNCLDIWQAKLDIPTESK